MTDKIDSSSHGKINVLNYTENDDGTANIEIEADQEVQKLLVDLGMQVILLCGMYDVTTDEVIKKMIEVYEDE